MNGSRNGLGVPCVLVDLNTQLDFFSERGACPVLESRRVHETLRRIVAWVKRYQVPVISSMDAHRTVELRLGGPPQHCIEGTSGQSKLGFTLMPNRLYVAGDNTLSIPVDLFNRHQQVIFPQRSKDLFANPKADRFLTQLQTDEFIVIGAVAEHEVKAVVLGLLVRNKRVTLVADACGTWNHSESELSVRQMIAKGATVITAEELRNRKLAKKWRYTADSLISAYRPIGYANPRETAKLNGTNGLNGLNGHNGNGRNGHNRSNGYETLH